MQTMNNVQKYGYIALFVSIIIVKRLETEDKSLFVGLVFLLSLILLVYSFYITKSPSFVDKIKQNVRPILVTVFLLIACVIISTL